MASEPTRSRPPHDSEYVELRVLAPRSALIEHAAAPVVISQRNCDVIGLGKRDFLALLRRKDCPLVVTRLGKLRLVETEALLAYLRELARIDASSSEPDVDDGAADVLRELGIAPRSAR